MEERKLVEIKYYFGKVQIISYDEKLLFLLSVT